MGPLTTEAREASRVLVLGGGYVALTLTRGLNREIERDTLHATVVSRDNYHVYHGLIGEMLTGRIAPGNVLSPARRIFGRASVHVAEVEKIDLERGVVLTSRHLDGARLELAYEHLVLCLGSSENFAAYPGLAEHAFKLKTFADCFRLRNHILTMFELADIEPDADERRRLLTFFVAGGGYAGTEVAGELAHFASLLTEHEFRGIRREECRVVLVHRGPTILPELYGSVATGKGHASLVRYAERHLERLGVELVTETGVEAATPGEVRLSDGRNVPTRTIISAVGTKPASVLDTLDLPRDERGRIRTDQHCRVEGRSDVWAGGDCAAVPHPDGGACPPVFLYAEQHGRLIAKNIGRTLERKPLRRFGYRSFGQGVSIGRRTVVGELKGIELKGHSAWLLWRVLALRFTPSWDRRLRLVADWLVWPLVGRDIVEMDHGEAGDYDVRHAVFQTGEVIVDRERPVRYVHVIVDGDVEVIRRREGEEEVVRIVTAGGHVGRKWLERSGVDAARARGPVRTLAIRAEQANRLQDVLLSAERIVAKTGAYPTLDQALEP
jgi:NADH dehydrogenase